MMPFWKTYGRRAAFCGLGALLLPTLAGGQGKGKRTALHPASYAVRAAGSGDSRPVSLRLKFKQGDKTRYQTTMRMVMPLPLSGQKKPLRYVIDMDLVQQQEVVKALPDGGGQVKTTVLKQENRVNGQYSPEQPIPPTTITYDAQGRILKMTGQPAAGTPAGPMGSLFNAGGMAGLGHFLPKQPVKPGDVWTQTVSIPVLGASAVAHSRFVGYQTVGAFRTAHIRSYVRLPIRLAMNAKGQFVKPSGETLFRTTGKAVLVSDSNLAVAEGKMIRTGSNGDIDMVITPNRKAASKSASKSPLPSHFNMDMKLSIGMNMIP